MDWDAILMAVNSDPTKSLNEGGVKIVKSRQCIVASSISATDAMMTSVVNLAKEKGYTIEKVTTSTVSKGSPALMVYDGNREIVRQCILEVCGDIVISPVDPSKCLVYSNKNGFLENRLKSDSIPRNVTFKLYEGNAHTFTIDAESFMVLEFY